MKKLQLLSLILGTVSALVNIYALISIVLGFTPDLPIIFHVLHIGIFICFAPAISSRTNRLKREKAENGLSSQDSIKAMWDGIPMIPFRILTIYTFVAIIYQGIILENQEAQAQPWLLFSVFWMAFYYISWAMLRNEQSYKVVA